MFCFSAPPPPKPEPNFFVKLFKKRTCPVRAIVGIMCFFACFVNYMMRVNISVNLIAMAPEKASTTSTTTTAPPNLRALADVEFNETHRCQLYDRHDNPNNQKARMRAEAEPLYGSVTFDWSAYIQAQILSGYFYGYALAGLIGGPAADFFGPKIIVMQSMVIGSIGTAICPPAAKWDWRALVVVRFILGFSGGFLYPALHVLVAHWSPPAEKGKFVAALLGGAIGTAATWCVSGPLIEALGWEFAFYIPGVIAGFFALIWWYLVYNSPVGHPRISDKEKKYILDCIGDKVTQGKTRVVAPFRKIFTSIRVLAHVVLHYGSNWGLYFLMTAAPKYMSACLGFKLSASAMLSSLPYLGRMFFSLGFGVIGDKIMREKWWSVTVMRKFFVLFSHIIPGLFLLSLGFTTNAMQCVILITLSLSFNGAACLTNLVNHQDLAPNYAGTLYGIANGLGNTAGFVTPLVTAHFTQHGNTINEWRPVFCVGAGTYIGAAVIFILTGTGKTQKWNYSEQVKK